MFVYWCFRKRPFPEGKYLLLYSFIVVSYVIWLNLFSIMRYVIPIEMLSAIVMVKFFQRIRAKGIVGEALILSFYIIGLYAVLSETSHNLCSWRFDKGDNPDKIMFMKPFKLTEDTLVKTYGYPSAMVAALLVGDQSNQIINYTNGYLTSEAMFIEKGVLGKKRQEIEKNHRGPVVAIVSYNTFHLWSFFYVKRNADSRVALLKKEGLFCRAFQYFDKFNICNEIHKPFLNFFWIFI